MTNVAATPDRPAAGVMVAFAPFAKWSPHFETDLEVIQDHLDKGGGAVVLSCDGRLKTCEPNPLHKEVICKLCRSRFRRGMEWLRGDHLSHEPFYCLDSEEEAFVESLRLRQWRDIDEVRAFRIDGVDIGLAAISSVVSLSREPLPDVRKYSNEIGDNLATAATVYFSLVRKLPALQPDLFAVFNARFSALRPALRVAQKQGIASLVHERAGTVDRYSLTKNTYPHDIEAIKAEMEDCFARAGELSAEQRAGALAWYEERRAGVEQSWYSFTASQQQGLLPEALDSSSLNVVVFNSSEDEFVAIEEWNNPFYANQNEALARLMTDIGDDGRIRFFLRVHPNLKGVCNSQVDGIEALAARHGHLHVIAADSTVSSYALIDAADVVVTFGSTVGIEACHARKPSILMGRAMYEDLGVCIRPSSHDAFVELIRACAAGHRLELPEGHELGLVKFGHFNKAWGQPFKHVVPDGLFAVRMRRDMQLTRIRAGWLPVLAYKAYCLVRWAEQGLTTWWQR